MQKLQYLQKIKPVHIKLILFLIILTWAGIGYACYGWQGAVLGPVILLLGTVLMLHVLILTMVAIGMSANKRGRHGLALGTLWVTQIPRLRRYNRKGLATQAFDQSKGFMAMKMFSNMAQGFGQNLPRR